MESDLRDLESQLNWCWYWCLLRVWQECGSFDSATELDRIRIAQQIRTDAEARSKEWAVVGLTNLIDHLLLKLNDPNPEVRQEAVIGLGDDCPKDHPAVDVLIDRLQSLDQSLHDRACAAWALGRIGAKGVEIVPILLGLIEEMKDQPAADELRFSAAEAIEPLTDNIDVLTTVAQHCLRDRFWQCRMKGLCIAERILKRKPELRDRFVPLIEPLLKDEWEGVRKSAKRLLE